MEPEGILKGWKRNVRMTNAIRSAYTIVLASSIHDSSVLAGEAFAASPVAAFLSSDVSFISCFQVPLRDTTRALGEGQAVQPQADPLEGLMRHIGHSNQP